MKSVHIVNSVHSVNSVNSVNGVISVKSVHSVNSLHSGNSGESAGDVSAAEESATIYRLLLLMFLHCLSVLLVNADKMVSSLFVSFTC